MKAKKRKRSAGIWNIIKSKKKAKLLYYNLLMLMTLELL